MVTGCIDVASSAVLRWFPHIKSMRLCADAEAQYHRQTGQPGQWTSATEPLDDAGVTKLCGGAGLRCRTLFAWAGY
jgi:hypothetical protein